MLVVQVHIKVKSEYISEFKEATLANARASLNEPGIARFDCLQSEEEPERFVLVEAYRSPEAPGAHKETSHYQAWRDTVAPMMAEPRRGLKYTNLFPEDARFETR